MFRYRPAISRVWLGQLFISICAACILAHAKEYPAFNAQPIAVNQVGYVTDLPKRFTAPKSPDGTRFAIRPVDGGVPLFRDEIKGTIGDFSSFQPKDPDKSKIHAQTVEQVAYVVWAWPQLKQWLPELFYQKCHDFCFENWEPFLGISSWWDPKTYLSLEDIKEGNPMGGLLHPYKGRHAPGHSIVPNLLMHEDAKREGRKDAAIYLDAAVKQAEWCVQNLDWNDPRTTKGHRMSEHRTIPNLIWMLQNYPQHAPAGLKNKVVAWVDVALARSDNLWDYRRYDLADH